MIGIVYDGFINAIQKVLADDENLSGRLSDLSDRPNTLELEEDLIEKFSSIPITYEILFKLPSSKGLGAERVKLSEDVQILEVLDQSKFSEFTFRPGNMLGDLLSPDIIIEKSSLFRKFDVFLLIKTRGIVNRTRTTSAMINSLSKLKQVLILGNILGILDISGDKQSMWPDPTLGLAVVLEENNWRENVATIDLPEEIYSQLHRAKLAITSGKISMELNFGSAENPSNTLQGTPVITAFSNAAKVLDSPDSDADASAIKAAVEWFYDSLTTNNQTISFLQTCIGLEAIFGDEVESEGLTKMLANRCAYLLGQSIQNRREIRSRFSKLYEVRSKLVHGRKLRLSDEELSHLEWGRKTLGSAIKKELGML